MLHGHCLLWHNTIKYVTWPLFARARYDKVCYIIFFCDCLATDFVLITSFCLLKTLFTTETNASVKKMSLTFTKLWVSSVDDKLVIFSYFA